MPHALLVMVTEASNPFAAAAAAFVSLRRIMKKLNQVAMLFATAVPRNRCWRPDHRQLA
jgi:hypothetical protein